MGGRVGVALGAGAGKSRRLVCSSGFVCKAKAPRYERGARKVFTTMLLVVLLYCQFDLESSPLKQGHGGPKSRQRPIGNLTTCDGGQRVPLLQGVFVFRATDAGAGSKEFPQAERPRFLRARSAEARRSRATEGAGRLFYLSKTNNWSGVSERRWI